MPSRIHTQHMILMAGGDVAFNQAYWSGQTRSDVMIEKIRPVEHLDSHTASKHTYCKHCMLPSAQYRIQSHQTTGIKAFSAFPPTVSWSDYMFLNEKTLCCTGALCVSMPVEFGLTENQYCWLANFSSTAKLFYNLKKKKRFTVVYGEIWKKWWIFLLLS